MSLSSNFNLESLNLDIETYNKEELIQILKLPNDYTSDMISKNKNSLQDKINKLSIDNSKKYTYLLFLDNAEKKLQNFNLFNDDATKSLTCSNTQLTNNNISTYDSNFIIENKSITHAPLKNITVGQYNDNLRIKHVSINSVFRPNYYNTQSSNFTITLPESLNNIISMRISSINIPFDSIYNITEELGNNTFTLNTNTKIDLSDGFYSSDLNVNNSIISALNDKVTDISFSIDSISKKVLIKDSSTNSNNFFLNFASNNNNIPLTLKLGWFLGFRAGIYYDAREYTSEAPITNTNNSRNFYIAINDYQNNNINKFSSAFSESLLPDNIITKINTKKEVNNSMEEAVDRTRYYDGPTQINKLTFTIYDEYGRVVSLNNSDWSCILTFEHYRAVKN